MHVLRSKLKHLRQRLRIWNREQFELVHEKVNLAKQKLDDIQKDLDLHGASEVRLQAKASTQKTYLDALRDEESFWRDKARMSQLSDGDRNTALFLRVARQRAIQNRIQLLRDEDREIVEATELGSHAVSYFSSIYSSQRSCVQTGLIDRVIPQLVTGVENDTLVVVPSEEEVKLVVFAMNPYSTPGPDGFIGLFYHCCWPIICGDLMRVVVIFFEQGRIAQGFNSNIVALIPKKPGADRISDFGSIAMANYAFKISTKILLDRLGGIASWLLSPEQTGFVLQAYPYFYWLGF